MKFANALLARRAAILTRVRAGSVRAMSNRTFSETCYQPIIRMTKCSKSSYILKGYNRKQSQKYFSTSSHTNRPFRILGVQQIALGSTDKETQQTLWQDIFGLQAYDTKILPKENVEEDILQVGVAPFQVEIDLMRPLDETKSPKVHVPPLNHFGLWVDDLELAVKWMQDQGVRFAPGGIRQGAAGHLVAFIHPKGNDEFPIGGNGVLIELVQAPQEVIDAYEKHNNQK